ncbi:poly polymerase and DNA-ligase Zn-finger region-domain-containing protein [Lipomyces oligophaga]|uniref:poly polymerase and DNA-ligase Zn-finger region-domain-containing protein n=1 Tax=Lipomyces oligophaga TaxID=45792 RepID=UPI0034CF6476
MVYRVEISKSSRAACQGAECKSQGLKIMKGELRLGVYVTIAEHQSFQWRHWKCVTKRVMDNIKQEIKNLDDLDGFSELDSESQQIVKSTVTHELETSGPHVDSTDLHETHGPMNGHGTDNHHQDQNEKVNVVKESNSIRKRGRPRLSEAEKGKAQKARLQEIEAARLRGELPEKRRRGRPKKGEEPPRKLKIPAPPPTSTTKRSRGRPRKFIFVDYDNLTDATVAEAERT